MSYVVRISESWLCLGYDQYYFTSDMGSAARFDSLDDLKATLTEYKLDGCDLGVLEIRPVVDLGEWPRFRLCDCGVVRIIDGKDHVYDRDDYHSLERCDP